MTPPLPNFSLKINSQCFSENLRTTYSERYGSLFNCIPGDSFLAILEGLISKFSSASDPPGGYLLCH